MTLHNRPCPEQTEDYRRKRGHFALHTVMILGKCFGQNGAPQIKQAEGPY